MPEKSDKRAKQRAERDLRRGKRPTTAAGEFVREEIHHIRQGKHGARSPEQAIAIGLAKARRAGVPLPPPRAGQAKPRTRRSAERAYEVGQGKRKPRTSSPKRRRAVARALAREPRSTASNAALGAHTRRVARTRSHADRSRAAREAAGTRKHARWPGSTAS